MTGHEGLHFERLSRILPPDMARSELCQFESKPKVLLYAKSKALIAVEARVLTRRFGSFIFFATTKQTEFEERIHSDPYDVIIIDYAAPGAEAVFVQATEVCPDVPCIFTGGMVGEERIARLLLQGVVDYVLKDRLGRLPYVIISAIKNAQVLREKKIAEGKLTRSLKHLEEAQCVAHMGSFEYNSAERRVIWSDEVFRIFGLDPDMSQSSFEPLLKMLDAPDRQRFIKNWYTASAGYNVQAQAYCFTHPDGEKRWFLLRAKASLNEETQASMLIGTVQDITETRAAEQYVKRRTEFEHTILSLSGQWINAAPDQFDGVMTDTMKAIAEHCHASWAAVYRFDHSSQTALCEYQWYDDKEPRPAVLCELPLQPIINALSSRKDQQFACVSLETCGGKISSFGVFALRTEGCLWGMLACSMTLNNHEHPEINLINLFSEMLISVLRRREKELALEEMCENNRLILDSISDGFCTFSRNGTVLDICKGLAARFGKTVQECLGINIRELLPEERYGKLAQERMAKLEKAFLGEPMKFIDTRDDRWYHNRFYPVVKDGCVAAVSLFSTDVTDKRNADEEYRKIILLEKEAQMLREKEREYLEMLDGSTEGSWILDVQSRVMRLSDQWQTRLGLCDEGEGTLFEYYDNVLHPEDKARVIEDSNRMLQSGTSKYKTEYRLKTIDSGYIWVLVQGKIIYNENGTPIKVYGTSIDITERKKMEDALRESQKLLSMIVEGVSDLIYLKDRESRIVMSNSAIAEFLGLKKSDLLGKNDMDYFEDKQQAQIIIENDQRIMASGQEQTVEERAGTRVLLSKKAPWHDVNGNVIGLVGISRDITERNRMMQQLKQTAEELRQKNQLITDFFINISHEFKTPISIMMISTELIDQYLTEAVPDLQNIIKSVAYVRQNVFRLSRLVNNLLDITKIDAGFMQPQLVNRNIADMLKYLVSSLQPYAQQKDIAISYNGTDKDMVMPADMVMMDRIVLNLVSNALKHTPIGGAIEVKCEMRTDSLCITVRDNGEGIPQDKQEIIFDRFRQVNTSLARTSEGCGIGLALVRSLVTVLGGRVWVESEPGIGSEFFVVLPVKEETDYTPAEVDTLMLDQRIAMELSDIVFV